MAKALGASLEIVTAYAPADQRRLRSARREAPEDIQWEINPDQEVAATLSEAAEIAAASGVKVNTHALAEDPRRRAPGRRRGAWRRPDDRRQQGDERDEAVPAGIGAEQDLPSRPLLGAHRPDDLRLVRSPRTGGRAIDGGPSANDLRLDLSANLTFALQYVPFGAPFSPRAIPGAPPMPVPEPHLSATNWAPGGRGVEEIAASNISGSLPAHPAVGCTSSARRWSYPVGPLPPSSRK